MIGKTTGYYQESDIIPIKIGNNIYDAKKKVSNDNKNKSENKVKEIKQEKVVIPATYDDEREKFPEISKAEIEKMVNGLLNKYKITKITPEIIPEEEKREYKTRNQDNKDEYKKSSILKRNYNNKEEDNEKDYKKSSDSKNYIIYSKNAHLIDLEYKKNKELMQHQITFDEMKEEMKKEKISKEATKKELKKYTKKIEKQKIESIQTEKKKIK